MCTMDDMSGSTLSLYVSSTLDTLGYSPECIRLRQQYAACKQNSFSKAYNKDDEDEFVNIIVVGSQCEGISLESESDCDVMMSLNEIVCSDGDVEDVDFIIERSNASAGYAMLKHSDDRFIANQKDNFILNSSFQSEVGELYLSSELLWYEVSNDIFGGTQFYRNGPAMTGRLRKYMCNVEFELDMDFVIAFPYKSQHHLLAWMERCRFYNWPSEELLQQINAMDGHIVPIGKSHVSEMYFREFRISYAQAETRLIRELNETQVRLLILLKLIIKHLLKPICPDITSYIAKNIVLWLAEKMPIDRFRLENLVALLMFTLKILQWFIRRKYVPSYFLPEKNLFKGKMQQTQHQRKDVLKRLCAIIDEGPTFLFNRYELRFFSDKLRMVLTTPQVALYEKYCRYEFLRYNSSMVEELLKVLSKLGVSVVDQVLNFYDINVVLWNSMTVMLQYPDICNDLVAKSAELLYIPWFVDLIGVCSTHNLNLLETVAVLGKYIM